MPDQFERTRMLLGDAAMAKLSSAHVIVFGVGGVGGHAVEALVRSGIGAIDIVDHDRVDITNVNRQIIATLGAIGEYKVDVMAKRIADINPNCHVAAHRCFYLPETADQFDLAQYDYVVDAVDTVTAKLQIIEAARAAGTPVISSMGAANKLDPTAFEVADIYETSVCPLAKIVRKECRKRGIDHLKVVYSKEQAIAPNAGSANDSAPDNERAASEASEESGKRKRPTPGSVSFVPSVAGLIIAGEVVKDLIAQQ